MAAVLGNIAGHNQLVSPWSPASFESYLGNYSGLSELGPGGWQLFGYGGPALPNGPWWPAGDATSGWKPIGPVKAIVNYGADIFFGGDFNTLSGAYPTDPPSQVADYSPFNNIFKWNSASGWSKLANAAGMPCVVPGALGVNGPVYAMDVDYSLCTGAFFGVWVGGSFSQAGGGSAWNIAFWDLNAGNTYWDVPATPTIVTPANGAVVVPPATVGVLANFTATGCSIAGVEFYEDKRLLATVTTPPYSFVWSGASVGTHTIRAIATDGNGRIATSDPVTFRMDNPPTVSVTSPANGAVFTAPANITVSATASDTDGSVTQVKFYANGSPIGTDTSAPYSLSWSSVPVGNYTITAEATDNDGAVATSPGVGVIVQ